MENSNIFNDGDLLDQNGKFNLDEAGKWARFLSIVGFVMLGLLLIVALFAGSLMSGIMSSYGSMSPMGSMGGAFFTVYFLVICGIAFYPTFMLYKFGSTIRAGVRTNDKGRFNEALLYLKRYFKFIGILTVIMIAIYVIIFLFSGLGALIGSR